MIRCLGDWVASYGRLLRCAFGSLPRSVRGWPVWVISVAALLAIQTVHWTFLLLDEILFSGYRRIPVREPLFVVGMPRSGTSFLHETLAEDPRYTTLRLRELLFTPSITQRRVAAGLAKLDRRWGRSGVRFVNALERWLRSRMGGVHSVDLDAPGEDFLLLAPAAACFLLVVAFPRSPAVWRLTRIDEWPDGERRALMSLYRRLLQRHLYATGGHRRILSKNPSFTGSITSLREEFFDARFVVCFREPLEAVPSQLSSLRPGAGIFRWHPGEGEIRTRFVAMYEYFGWHVLDALGSPGNGRAAFVELSDLRGDLAGTVRGIYEAYGWVPDSGFAETLRRRGIEARRHRSRHTYDPDSLGLDPDELSRRLGPVMAALRSRASGRSHNVPSDPLEISA